MIRGIRSKKCPADAFVKKLRKDEEKRQKIKYKNQEIPEEYKVPDKVYLTENCIRYFNEISGADHLIFNKDDKKNQKDITFYWEKLGNIPALELIISLDEDGKWILKYIKEEKIDNIKEIEWKYDGKKEDKKISVVYMDTDEKYNLSEIDNSLEESYDDYDR